jgi:CubicO group peptidase (beta-lactamase class C family)
MTRTLFALLLIFGQFPLAAAPRRRAVHHPPPYAPPAAIVAAASQAAEAALKAGIPAVQIAVSHRGRVIYSEAFGVTNKESATAATPRSILQIASVTKQFTAAAILRLAERGALSLDDRIEKFVPEFDPKGATITLRHLLSHTSGVRSEWYPPTPPFPSLFTEVTREEAIKGFNAQPLNFTPGTNWSYSNGGYLLLGYAIESITGGSYADFIHKEFALPLGLIDTALCGTNNLPQPSGYAFIGAGTVKAVPATHTSGGFSSGKICSTASDLARWSHLLATGRAILPASYATMITPARLSNGDVVPFSYAMGLSAEKALGHPAVAHSGGGLGFEAYLLYLSNQEIAVAVITNGAPTDARPTAITLAVAKAALDTL